MKLPVTSRNDRKSTWNKSLGFMFKLLIWLIFGIFKNYVMCLLVLCNQSFMHDWLSVNITLLTFCISGELQFCLSIFLNYSSYSLTYSCCVYFNTRLSKYCTLLTAIQRAVCVKKFKAQHYDEAGSSFFAFTSQHSLMYCN